MRRFWIRLIWHLRSKVAPLGDPLEISLRGYELTLRKSEAQMISVVMLDEEEEK